MINERRRERPLNLQEGEGRGQLWRFAYPKIGCVYSVDYKFTYVCEI